MVSGTNSPLGPGQRALAAIVFTDVVSFSARMQANEEGTLALLQRDFDAMREICVQHQGAVLKTTGDGLLLYFSSAVQAVACALAMQRFFAEHGKTRPTTEHLTHRVGIHLGDVFVNEQDVMGDGVNIAARLQAEAEPGGICISQTVYDVVKNKLALSVTRLGPRELKNISQHIPIYKLLLKATTMENRSEELPPEGDSLPSMEPMPVTRRRGTRRILLIAGPLVAVGLALWLVVQNNQAKEEEAAAAAALAAREAMLTEDSPDPANRARLATTLAAWRSELRDQRSRAAEEYDFAELAKTLRDPRSPVAGKPEQLIRQQVLLKMQGLFGWLGTALQRYNQDAPLVVTELSGTAPKEIKVFTKSDRLLYTVEGRAVRQRGWSELKPSVIAAITAAALHETRPLPPRDAVLGAQAFASFYQLPELTEALRKNRLKRPNK